MTELRHISIGNVTIGNDLPLAIIAGPCQLESRDHGLEVATALAEIAGRLGVGLIYKTSFDKANRTSISTERGLGLEESLPIFAEILPAGVRNLWKSLYKKKLEALLDGGRLPRGLDVACVPD